MDRRLFLVVLLTLVGLASVTVSGFMGDWSADAIAAILLELGAALLLVPSIFWGERQITARMEAVRRQIRSEIRGMQATPHSIRLKDVWEDMHPALERIQHIRNEAFVSVPVTGSKVWLNFGTFREFNKITWQLNSKIGVYASKPTETSHPDSYYEWQSGQTLDTAVGRCFEIAIESYPGVHRDSLSKEAVVSGLQAAVLA